MSLVQHVFSATRSALILTAAVSLASSVDLATSQAELTVITDADGQSGLTVYKMTVTPAAEPSPALAHNFIPRSDTLQDGNAALFYLRSFAEGQLASRWQELEKEHGNDEVHGGENGGWYSIETPLDEATLAKARLGAAKFDTIVEQFVSRATVRRQCDWGHHIDELRGLEIMMTLLPEAQESRSLTRALMLRARVAVADGDYERAITEIRMAYQLARHTAQAPFLVSCLVGVAEASMANGEAIELIAAKDSPNLYWALAELPRPFINMVPSIRFEMSLGTRTFPFLLDAETTEHSPEEWARLLTAGFQDAQQATSSGGAHVDDLSAQAGITGMAIVIYPAAKERLIASGMDANRVEQMPVGQVIAIDSAREYRRIGDEVEKQWYLSYQAAKEREKEMAALFADNKLTGGFGRVLAGMLMPAINSVRIAQMRLDWQLNAIQAVEAIRMHAAEHGTLPTTLEEITVVPVPLNPVTEKPYQYRLDGETAILELPFSDGIPGVSWRFEIKLAK